MKRGFSHLVMAILFLAWVSCPGVAPEVSRVVTPVITPDAGTYTTVQTITIACATADAEIYYTTDGAEPTRAATLYSSAFSVSSPCLVQARAFADGMDASDIAVKDYAVYAVSVVAGEWHNIALRSDGSVWAWGSNLAGMLGIGTTDSYAIPVPLSSLQGAVAVAAGYAHSIVRASALFAMGDNSQGQIGDGTIDMRTSPVAVSSSSFSNPGTAIAAGREHSLAVAADGYVWAWGDDSYGQLGNDVTLSDSRVPVRVSAISGIVAVAAGDYVSLALKSDGTVWAWGYNGNGMLGDNSTTQRPTPVQVMGIGSVGFITNAVAIAAGWLHSLALLSDGTILAWGFNSSGQLGDSSNAQRLTPVAVTGISTATAIAAGASHSLARLSDGTVWAWGMNANGQLGNNTTTNSNAPVAVLEIDNAVQVSAGTGHSVAVLSDGTVRAWGWNLQGQLGNASTDSSPIPVAVSGLRLW